jgi:hypothetical protein
MIFLIEKQFQSIENNWKISPENMPTYINSPMMNLILKLDQSVERPMLWLSFIS